MKWKAKILTTDIYCLTQLRKLLEAVSQEPWIKTKQISIKTPQLHNLLLISLWLCAYTFSLLLAEMPVLCVLVCILRRLRKEGVGQSFIEMQVHGIHSACSA